MLHAPRRHAFVLSLTAALSLGACSTPATDGGGAAGTTGQAGTSGGAGTGAAGTNATGVAGTTGVAGQDGGAAGTGAAGTGSAAGTTGSAGTMGFDGGTDDSGIKVMDPGTKDDGDFMIGPTYVKAPELTQANVPHGVIKAFTIDSKESPIFPGVTGAYTRQGWIYIPSQYVAGTAAPFIIAQDGRDYMARLPAILDNLIAAKKVPVMVAIMVMAGPGDGPGSERGFEYDTVSTDFVDWVETCVLPKMTKQYGVKFTTSPEGRASMGGSSGATAAFTMAWFRPDLYRRVLSFSGTFTAQAKTAAYPAGAWEYHQHMIAESATRPIRTWLEVAEMDAGATNTEASMKNWIIANQRMAAVLKTKGYHYHFDYAKGAVHNDPKVWDQTLPGALEWLWRGYPTE